jgi:hypothetical protein
MVLLPPSPGIVIVYHHAWLNTTFLIAKIRKFRRGKSKGKITYNQYLHSEISTVTICNTGTILYLFFCFYVVIILYGGIVCLFGNSKSIFPFNKKFEFFR